MKRDTHKTVTDAIIKMLETGTQPWAAQWKNGKGGKAVMPTNCITGKPYRGINVVLLWGEAQAKGYENSSWMTFQQAVTAKAKLRKGEKGTSIVFWSKLTLKDEETGEEEDRMYCKEYTVFNVAQFETLPEKFETGTVFESEEARIDYADQVLNAVGADIRHGGNSAYFLPSRDYVQMPVFEAFHTAQGYYSTLAHELTHWTGHKDRLAREFGKRFGDEAYAFEELVAELGAAFVMAGLGISAEPREDHAAYIASWIKVLKGDKRAIFTAASKAQAAFDLLFELSAKNMAKPVQGDLFDMGVAA